MKLGQRLIHPLWGKGVVVDIINIDELYYKVYYVIKFDKNCCPTTGFLRVTLSLIEAYKPDLKDKYRGSNFLIIDGVSLNFYDVIIEGDEHFKARKLKEKFGEDYEDYMKYLGRI